MGRRKKSKSTSDDADAKVEKNDGVSKGSGGDGQSAHESPSHDHRAAAKAVHQHAANGPCNSSGREEKKNSHQTDSRRCGESLTRLTCATTRTKGTR